MYLRLNLSTTPDSKFYKPQHCPVLDPVTGNFKASQFCRIIDRFTRRGKVIQEIEDPDNQRPVSAVLLYIPSSKVTQAVLSYKHGVECACRSPYPSTWLTVFRRDQ